MLSSAIYTSILTALMGVNFHADLQPTLTQLTLNTSAQPKVKPIIINNHEPLPLVIPTANSTSINDTNSEIHQLLTIIQGQVKTINTMNDNTLNLFTKQITHNYQQSNKNIKKVITLTHNNATNLGDSIYNANRLTQVWQQSSHQIYNDLFNQPIINNVNKTALQAQATLVMSVNIQQHTQQQLANLKAQHHVLMVNWLAISNINTDLIKQKAMINQESSTLKEVITTLNEQIKQLSNDNENMTTIINLYQQLHTKVPIQN